MSHTVYLSQLLKTNNCDIVHMQSVVNTSSKSIEATEAIASVKKNIKQNYG